MGTRSGPRRCGPCPGMIARCALRPPADRVRDTMTDVDAAAGQEAAQATAPNLRILAQFIRDLSFENPRAPDSLRAEGRPNIELGVEMSARGRADGLFEVDLKLSARATREAEVAFQVELLYGGLFEVSGVPADALEPVLLTEC